MEWILTKYNLSVSGTSTLYRTVRNVIQSLNYDLNIKLLYITKKTPQLLTIIKYIIVESRVGGGGGS